MPIKMIKEFIKLESAGGIVLFVAAVLAWVIDNSAWAGTYNAILAHKIGFDVPMLHFKHSLVHWINDGLMVIFFFLVGLEMKRELFLGELNSFSKCLLPALAGAGGMIAPAILFALFNGHNADHLQGWAIPAATDIAFSLGVLSLLGSRIPLSLKVFLTALAIFDDLGAILVIAFFYTEHISWLMLGMSGVIFVLLIIMNRLRVMQIWPYILLGILLWVCVLQSGVHATVAGILLAFTIPLHDRDDAHDSPLVRLEHNLLPWVAFVILPIFAFANAGVSLAGLSVSDLTSGVTLGIVFGLLIGKPVGISLFTWLGNKFMGCKLPTGVSWTQIIGVGLVAGIGFTMSLFIGSLAYEDLGTSMRVYVRLGVVCGSILAAGLGFLLLRLKSKRQEYMII